jgi:hypothetical protein
MITMQMMNIASDNSEIAQTMKAPVTKLWVEEWIVLLGRSARLFFMIPSKTAAAAEERTPKTPANPANKYVCCLPWPKSWMCAPLRYRICLASSNISMRTAIALSTDATMATTLALTGEVFRDRVTANMISKVNIAVPLATANAPSAKGNPREIPIATQ